MLVCRHLNPPLVTPRFGLPDRQVLSALSNESLTSSGTSSSRNDAVRPIVSVSCSRNDRRVRNRPGCAATRLPQTGARLPGTRSRARVPHGRSSRHRSRRLLRRSRRQLQSTESPRCDRSARISRRATLLDPCGRTSSSTLEGDRYQRNAVAAAVGRRAEPVGRGRIRPSLSRRHPRAASRSWRTGSATNSGRSRSTVRSERRRTRSSPGAAASSDVSAAWSGGVSAELSRWCAWRTKTLSSTS